jgi:hypothetical protein
MFLAHPISFLARYADTYKLHSEYTSQMTAAHRRQKVDDVRKRAEFRKAHGLDAQEGIFGGWSARGEGEGERVAVGKTDKGGVADAAGVVGMEMASQAKTSAEAVDKEGAEAYAGTRRRPVIKKWLGIW